MKIAMLSLHSSPLGELGTADTGGMSVYIRELAREMGRLGDTVDIFTQRFSDDGPEILSMNPNVRLIHLSIDGQRNIPKSELFDHLPDFVQALDAFRKDQHTSYDVIHSHYWLSGVVGDAARNSWNIPHLLTFHTLGAVKNMTCEGEQEPRLRIETERRLAAACDHALTATEGEKQLLVEYLGVSPGKVEAVPCGVNMDVFAPVDKGDARKRLGLDPDAPIALYAGRFAPVKGIDRLIEAFGILNRQRPCRLLLVGGDGPDAAGTMALKKQIADLGLDQAVFFAGRVDQTRLPLYCSATDVTVAPSYYESFGLVMLESLACGTPVVTARVGAADLVIQPGRNGYIVDDDGPPAFAAAADGVLGRRGEWSAREIRTSVRPFTWSASAMKILDIYKKVSHGNI